MRSPECGNRIEIGRVASLGQSGGESVAKPQPSPLATECCIELLHDLNNAFAAVLMNAQVLDGKLPSYSRSKRYIHEIERSAQRGGALLKRLLERLPGDEIGSCDTEAGSERVPPVAERIAAVAKQGPNAAAAGALGFCVRRRPHMRPLFFVRWQLTRMLTEDCDCCTSL